MSIEKNTHQKVMLNSYYNSSQRRAESWNKLKNTASQLSDIGLTAEELNKYKSRVEELLRVIEPFETYWGFPGRNNFNQLKDIYWRKIMACLQVK